MSVLRLSVLRGPCLGVLAGALAALSLVLAPAASAGPPGTWTKLERNGTTDSAGVGGVRTSDGVLHLLWSHTSGNFQDELVHVPVAADGSVGTPAPITTGWGFLGQPAGVLTGDDVRAVFPGDAPSSIGASGGFTATAPGAGSPWSTPAKISNGSFSGGVAGATVGPGGTLFSIFPGARVHRGTDPGDADHQLDASGSAANENIATDGDSGEIWAAWGAGDFADERTKVQEVDPLTGGALGAVMVAPRENGQPLPRKPDQRVALAGRPGRSGVFLAYADGDQLLLWRIGDPAPRVLADGGGQVTRPALAAAPGGRLWVVWHDASTAAGLRARLSDEEVASFSETIDLTAPTGSIQRLQAFAGSDGVDIVAAGTLNSAHGVEHHTRLANPVGNGSISGTVYDTEADAAHAVEGAHVQVCSQSGGGCRTRTTDAAGAYTVDDLAAGTYKVSAYPPSGSDLYPGTRVEDSVLGQSASLTGQDVILEPPRPLPQGIRMSTRYLSPQGVPVVNAASATDLFFAYDEGYTWEISFRDPSTGETVTCCHPPEDFGDGGEIPPPGDGGPFWPPPPPPGETPPEDQPPPPGTRCFDPRWCAQLDPGQSYYYTRLPPWDALMQDLFQRVIHGPVEMFVKGFKDGAAAVEFAWHEYIDPSGHVRRVDGTPLVGATVTLLRSDDPGGPFTVVPDGSDIMSPNNRKNPDLTDYRGHFGWDVIAGYYKVRAASSGCRSPSNAAQAFVESRIMTIPPPVTDLDLRLDCPVPDSGGGTPPPSGSGPPPASGPPEVPPPAGAAATSALPLIPSLTLPRRARDIRVGKKGKFRLRSARLACPEASQGACSLTVRVAIRKVGAATLTRKVVPGGSKAVRGKLSKKGLRRLKRARRLKATISIVASAPGGGTVTRSVAGTLVRPRR